MEESNKLSFGKVFILSIPICLYLYFIFWLWDIVFKGTFHWSIYLIIFIPFLIWAFKISEKILDKTFDNNDSNYTLNLAKGLKICITRNFTIWVIWLSLLTLVLYFFNLFQEFNLFYLIFFLIIIFLINLFFSIENLQTVSIFLLTILNLLGILFHSSYYLGIDSNENKELYFAYNETNNFEKMNYYLEKCIKDSSNCQFSFDEFKDIVRDNRNYDGNKIYESKFKYPLEHKEFKYSKHDSLVNELVYSFFNKTDNYYSFIHWLKYLISYGHYDKALRFSKDYEKFLMNKLYEFKDWEEYFDLLKRGILPREKLFPENQRKSDKWVDAYIELKEYQYHYYKYINDEDLMSQTLSEYYKIDMYNKNSN